MRTSILLSAALLTGCVAAASPSGSITLPWPGQGASATYGDDSGAALTIDVRGLTDVLDASGAAIETLHIHLRIERTFENERRATELDEFVDAIGNKALVASSCAGLGRAYPPPGTDCGSTQVTASWLEHGIPGALGVSMFWGRPLSAGIMDQPVRVGAIDMPVRYQAVPEMEDCLALRAAAAVPQLGGQWFSETVTIPDHIVVCDNEPFARVTGAWTRLAMSEGAPVVAPRGTAADPVQPPASGAARPVDGIPPGQEGDPSGLLLADAVAQLRSAPQARPFVSAHPHNGVRSSSIQGGGYSTTLGIEMERHVTRRVILEADDGTTLTGSVTKECPVVPISALCGFTTSDVSTSTATPTTPTLDARASLPYATLAPIAARALGREAESAAIATMLFDVDRPALPISNGYVHRFFLSSGALGVPYMALIDSTNGVLLQGHFPRVEGLAATGLSDADLAS